MTSSLASSVGVAGQGPQFVSNTRLRRLAAFEEPITISFRDGWLAIETPRGTSNYDLVSSRIEIYGFWWGSALQVSSRESRPRLLKGFLPWDAERFIERSRAYRETYLADTLSAYRPAVFEALAKATSLFDGRRYLRTSRWIQFKQQVEPLRWFLALPSNEPLLPDDMGRALAQLSAFAAHGSDTIAAHNQRFVDDQIARHSIVMVNHDGKPLTTEQQTAVIIDEDNNLVVASAGSGKTSVIEAKFRYLTECRQVDPASILVLAFNRNTVAELRSRLGDSAATIETFHALGKDIIAQATGRMRSVTPMAEDDAPLLEFVQAELGAILRNPSRCSRAGLLDFLLNLLSPPLDDLAFASSQEYVKAMKAADYRSLRGEKVKSYGELAIANHLAACGIPYEYEAPYTAQLGDARRRAYRPDFRIDTATLGLPTQTYIEYFGVDEHGNTRPGIDGESYRRDMTWKIEQHRLHGTRLIQLAYHDLKRGRLIERLDTELGRFGISQRFVDAFDLFRGPKEAKSVSKLAALLSNFLRLYKGSLESIASLREQVPSATASFNPAERRARAFLTIFESIIEAYEAHLAKRGEIDFEDMIRLAIDAVRSGRYQSWFTHILVDEFQDISPSRAELVLALRRQLAHCGVTVVGDDWQSINRFAGSQIRMMTDFQRVFGATRRVDLTLTHRFPGELADLSSSFVTANPSQLRKEVYSTHRQGKRPVKVFADERDLRTDSAAVSSNAPASHHAAETAISWLTAQLPKGARILVLARYNKLLPDRAALERRFAGYSFETLTIHRAKGQEGDGVLLLRVNEHNPSFPSTIGNDPLLDLVLAASDSYPHAEERRLFYVALTRSRGPVAITTSADDASPFIRELMQEPLRRWVDLPEEIEHHTCTRCETGILLRKQGTNGVFFACSSFPYCDFTQNVCTSCREGMLVRDGYSPDRFRCSNRTCANVAETCPRCRSGWIGTKTGRHGSFWGCSNFPDCAWTTNSAPEQPVCLEFDDVPF